MQVLMLRVVPSWRSSKDNRTLSGDLGLRERAGKLSAESWTSLSCIMGGSNVVDSNLRLRKGRPRPKAWHFLCVWNCSKKDVGLLIKTETILKEVHWPLLYFFRLYFADLLYPKIFFHCNKITGCFQWMLELNILEYGSKVGEEGSLCQQGIG